MFISYLDREHEAGEGGRFRRGSEQDRTLESVLRSNLAHSRSDRDGGEIGEEVAEQRSSSALAATFEAAGRAAKREWDTGARNNGRPGRQIFVGGAREDRVHEHKDRSSRVKGTERNSANQEKGQAQNGGRACWQGFEMPPSHRKSSLSESLQNYMVCGFPKSTLFKHFGLLKQDSVSV